MTQNLIDFSNKKSRIKHQLTFKSSMRKIRPLFSDNPQKSLSQILKRVDIKTLCQIKNQVSSLCRFPDSKSVKIFEQIPNKMANPKQEIKYTKVSFV
jgi:hypothetical protein